jgi:hypothetical protein
MARSLAAGAAGAAALTGIHELGRSWLDDAPRMDLFGRRALKKAGVRRRGRKLYEAALASDLASNALFYALTSAGRPDVAPWRGLALGALAGAGALAGGPALGLGRKPALATPSTAALTVAWYALGGLVAGLVARSLFPRAPAGGLVAGRAEGHTRPSRWRRFDGLG